MTPETIASAERRLAAFARRVPRGAYRPGDTSYAQYNELYAAHLLHALGEDADTVTAIIDALSRTQEADGFLPATETVAGTAHDAVYLRLHKSALFFQLADAYGREAKAPDLDAIMPASGLRRMLASLDWRNIWLHSNVLLGIATAAAFSISRGRHVPHLSLIADAVATTQDPSGLWGETRGASRINAMAGTFHLVPILQAAGHDVPRRSALGRTVMSLQTPSGFFCGPTGYSCIEYDAAYLLRTARECLPETERQPYATAGRTLLRAMLGIQEPDGGFPEMGRPSGLVRALRDVVVPGVRHRDAATLLWNVKKLARVYLDARRPFLNNSVAECAALPHESNLF